MQFWRKWFPQRTKRIEACKKLIFSVISKSETLRDFEPRNGFLKPTRATPKKVKSIHDAIQLAFPERTTLLERMNTTRKRRPPQKTLAALTRHENSERKTTITRKHLTTTPQKRVAGSWKPLKPTPIIRRGKRTSPRKIRTDAYTSQRCFTEEFTMNGLFRFFAISLFSSCHSTRIRQLWSNDCASYPFVRNLMSRGRFLEYKQWMSQMHSDRLESIWEAVCGTVLTRGK